VLAALAPPSSLEAQRVEGPPQLGLGASSALTVYSGAGIFPYASLGPQVGAMLDIGWIGSRNLRLSVGVDYLATTIDRTDTLGVRETGGGYVFSALADVTLLGPVARRVTPYLGAGFGVDAVGTTIQNEQIGAIYNTNVFDLHAQVGALVRVARRGRLSVEARGTGARVVRRFAVRVGYTWLYNQLR
jgi:hypothetical protein